jgi:hypothetical protein
MVNKTESKMKITAAEARELAGPTPQERVDAVYPRIREAAEKGQRSIQIGVDFWAHEGYKGSADYKEAVRLLEADGYTVKFYYEERQFVDMGTEISW